MTLRNKPTRVAVLAAASLMAAGTVVAATSTSAQAAAVTTDYTCSAPSIGLGPWDISVLSELPGIEAIPAISAGFDVPADFVTVENTFTIPDAAHDTLAAANVENLSFPDYAGSFGDEAVGVSGMTATVSGMTDNGDGTWSFDSDGLNAAFEVPAAGVYDLLSPAGFTMVAAVPGLGDVNVVCTLAEGAATGTYHTVTVNKNDSETTGTVVNPPVEKGTRGKIKATVSAPNQTPTGKVIAKKGDNTIGAGTLNDKGKVTITLDRLPVGKHRVVLKYKGDGYTNTSSSAPIIVKVVR